MEGLAPLIKLAGADGRINTAGLQHLIAQAQTRGVSEADAHDYITDYATARGWRLGKPSQSAKARAEPVPPTPLPVSPQAPAQPSPVPIRPHSNPFWRIVPSSIGFAAAVGLAVLLTVSRQPLAPPTTLQPAEISPVPPASSVKPSPLPAPLPPAAVLLPSPPVTPAPQPAPAPPPVLQPEGQPDLQGKVTRIYAAEALMVDGQFIRLCGLQDYVTHDGHTHSVTTTQLSNYRIRNQQDVHDGGQ